MNYRMLLARTVFCGLATIGYAYGNVLNPGFEDINSARPFFTNWTQTGDFSFDIVIANTDTTCGGQPIHNCSNHSGTYAAFFGNPGAGGITQSVDTVAGYNYTVDFFLSVGVDNTTPDVNSINGYSVFWDSTPLTSVVNPSRGGGWQEITKPAISTGSSSLLTFMFYDNLDAFGLDDVSVTQGAPFTASAVPEPVSLILAGTSLIALAGLSRMMRRKRR